MDLINALNYLSTDNIKKQGQPNTTRNDSSIEKNNSGLFYHCIFFPSASMVNTILK